MDSVYVLMMNLFHEEERGCNNLFSEPSNLQTCVRIYMVCLLPKTPNPRTQRKRIYSNSRSHDLHAVEDVEIYKQRILEMTHATVEWCATYIDYIITWYIFSAGSFT